MKIITSRGFTLIEILIVIGIIGVLSSVVLSSINLAKQKASDTAIKSDLTNILGQAEIQYSTYGCYNTAACTLTLPLVVNPGTCTTYGSSNIFGENKIAGQINHATSTGSGLSACSATARGTAWAVAVQLKTDPTKAWCVDNTGASRLTNTVINDQTSMNTAVAGSVCN